MPTDDFDARPGHAFTFHTVPVGDVGGWDDVVRCRVLEVIGERRLSWTSNALRVETVVVITLDDLGGRTLVTVDHSGWEGCRWSRRGWPARPRVEAPARQPAAS